MNLTVPVWVICMFLLLTSLRLLWIGRQDHGAWGSVFPRLLLAGTWFSLEPLGYDQQTRAFLFRWAFLFVIVGDELNYYSRWWLNPQNRLDLNTKLKGYFEVAHLWTRNLHP